MDELPASDGCCRDAPAGGRTSESADGTTKSERGRRNLRDRTPRRFFSEKVRYKRQTLQNMARPLKRWLYSYRENPYPSRTEKMQLAVGSQMTLTQVSNWFANARRRIKNTVQTPNLSWSARIKLYNDHVEGNADLFSVSSDDDSIWNPGPDTDEPQNSTFRSDSEHRLISGELTRDSSALNASEGGHHVSESLKMDPEQHFGLSEDFGSHPKYKQSILQRYLNDTYQHVMPAFVEDAPFTKTRGRRESGSLGSRDYEEMSTSSAASPLNDNHLNVFEDFPEELEMARKRRPADDNGCEEDIYWKEISAALALASLARSKKKT